MTDNGADTPAQVTAFPSPMTTSATAPPQTIPLSQQIDPDELPPELRGIAKYLSCGLETIREEYELPADPTEVDHNNFVAYVLLEHLPLPLPADERMRTAGAYSAALELCNWSEEEFRKVHKQVRMALRKRMIEYSMNVPPIGNANVPSQLYHAVQEALRPLYDPKDRATLKPRTSDRYVPPHMAHRSPAPAQQAIFKTTHIPAAPAPDCSASDRSGPTPDCSSTAPVRQVTLANTTPAAAGPYPDCLIPDRSAPAPPTPAQTITLAETPRKSTTTPQALSHALLPTTAS
ncbi:hypothetical protein SEPCBS119000_001638 [Sporothrix epigloea]|uniref:Uncharacterized protein n=1 Tax=Sporothrix epigloea TaxID=1892477 RepID=A0ABP0DFP4_9PEZI